MNPLPPEFEINDELAQNAPFFPIIEMEQGWS